MCRKIAINKGTLMTGFFVCLLLILINIFEDIIYIYIHMEIILMLVLCRTNPQLR